MTTKNAQPTVEELQAELTAVQERFVGAVNGALQWATDNGTCGTFDTVMQHIGLPVRSGRKVQAAARYTVTLDIPVETSAEKSHRTAVNELNNDPSAVRDAVVEQLRQGGGSIRLYDRVNSPVPFTYEDLLAPASSE